MATSGGQTLGVTISANMDPSGVLGAVKQMQGAFSGLKLPANLTGDILKDFNKLQESLKKFDSIAKQDHFSKADLRSLEKLQKEIDSTFDSLKGSFNDLGEQKFYLDADYTKIKEAKVAVDELKADIQSKLSEIKIDFSSTKGGTTSLGLDELISGMERGVKSSKVLSAAMGEVKQSLKAGDFGAAANQLSQIITKSNDLKGAGTGLLNIFKQWGLIDFSTPANELVKTKKGAELLATALSKIVPEISKDNEAVQTLVEKLQEAIKKKEGLEKTGAENLAKEMSTGAQSAEQLGSAFKTAGQSSREMAQGVSQAAEQVKQLQQSTQYFFSLRNMINLLKRGIREAVDVVKELDAAMTETAVVTDYSVSDMWQKLPEYTANANALGATVKDMYEATTLYYQQGLRTEAAMGIANETMKMARIGGLEAADATDKMTAALRGFNMEINEMSAQRVNDVYSNLAAKTASNTEELGTAMQRTASIAHSAGMSFEGTAAFLAQAIETTREPAENLGTAMKTIVARFTELKKNPLEIAEVDGEEVSYNKVDTALQSIGVSLKDANGQFRDLDKVFLDISKRWDSLTQTQQRYIATTAAGSRQQSRFIAMMSNYERTMQLMDFANNSAGASTEQFGKTMESLEAKINKLHNAWNEFLMGIMNDKWTKRLVDAGTGILNLVNKIIDKLSFNGELGLVKSFLSIATAFTALKAGGNIINKLIGGLGGLVDPTSSFGKGFWGAGKTTAQGTSATGVAGKITTPIVAKLNELIAVTRQANNLKNTNTQAASTLGQYKNTSAMLRNTQSLGMEGIRALFNGLSDEHAYAAYKNTPGTVDAMKKAALGWLGSQKMPADAQKTGQQLMSAIFKGMSKKEIPIKDGMKLIGKPALWGEYFGTDVAKSFSQQYINQFKAQIPQMKQNTQTALQQTWQQLLGKNANNKAMQQGFLASQTGKDKFISAYKNNRASLGLDQESINNIPVIQNRFQQLANTAGIFGSKFSAAGMSLQMFGAQLGQLSPALQGVGTLLAQVGMAVNTFGMGISGIGSTVVKTFGRFSAAAGAAKAASAYGLTAKTTANVFLGTLTEGLSAGAIGGILGVALVGGIMIAKGIADKKAREAGQEVKENFEKGFTETNKKIDLITEYKDRFNELSQGVDQFGHNINLTDEEFDEYLSISRELQELSPSLISGYNAEGQAILRKGAALDEVINKLKEERDLSLDSYISNDSVEKLIKAYNISDAYKQHHTTIKDTASQNTVVSAFDNEKTDISKAIKKAGLGWSDFSQILDELGIGGAESINQLTNTQLGLISDHYIDILNKIKEFNPQIEQEAEEGLKEAFADTNNAIQDVLTEGAPITEALRQWMGQEHLDAVGLNLGEEFVGGFNSGLEGLMLEGLTNNWKPEEYKQQLKEYSDEWKNLAGPTSDYTRILKEADKIQEDYLDHIGEEGAVEDYKENIEDSAQKLEDLANSTDTATEAGQIFAEQCMQQANALRNYATEGAMSLSEALNVLSGKFAEARGAKERFDKAIEGGDYYTAAEGFRSIAETVLDDKNVAGDGSLTGWIGAEQLLGQNFVDNHSWDQIVSHLKTVNGLFDDGIEGVYNFNDMLVQAVNEGKDLSGLGEVIDGAFHFDFDNVDNLKQYADLLGISEDVLTGMIDKSRQFAAFNVGNNKQIRQALEQSEQAMVGQTYGKNGKSNLYMSEAAFRTEAYAQGIRGNDYTKTKSDLTKEQNVQFLTVDSLTTKSKDGLGIDKVLKDVGLDGADKTLNNTVAALTKMGFDLEDQKRILTTDGLKLADGNATADAIEQAYQEQEFASENPTVAGIANNTGVIATAATALLAKMGILTDQAKKDIETSTSKDTVDGIKKSLTPDGGFKDASSREAARAGVESKIADYNATIANLESSGNEALQPYIDKLISARDDLQLALDTEADSWKTKLSEASELVKDIGTKSEQDFLQSKAVDIENIVSQEDITKAATALRQLEEEGNLSHSTMAQLAADFLQLRQNDLSRIDSSQIDNLCTKLGLTKDEATELLDILQVPFSLEGRLSGEDLTAYINEVDGLTTTERTILLNADLSGEEKVSAFIDEVNAEFGDGTEKTKSIILQAEAKMAGGDQTGAEKLLADAGFNENQVKEITQQLSITVNGTIANKGEVQQALTSQLNDMDLSAEVKAKVSAKLDIQNQKSNLNQTGTISYKSKVDQGAVNQAKSAAAKGADMPIKAVDKASSTIQSIRNKAGKSVSFNVSPNFTGTWTKTLTIKTNKVPENARGRGFSIPAHQTLSFGAAAEGMNIPKKKRVNGSQVTALVGEEGYEVGYIPSEQRSVIFGTNGPEMTSFPSDTVIYPHNQSKEIIRRGKGKHQTAGSFVSGILPSRSSGGGGGEGSNSSKSKSSDSTSKKVEKAAKTVEDSAKEATDTIQKAYVWWENIARKTEASQRQQDKNQKEFEKYLKQVGANFINAGKPVSEGGGGGDNLLADMNKTLAYYEAQVKKGTEERTQLVTGTKEQTAANNIWWRGDHERGYTESQKANKAAYENNILSGAKISYKNGKDTVDEFVNLSGYIRQGADGSLEVVQEWIDGISNLEKRKAVADAANKAADDITSKINKAEDGIEKTKEAIEKMGETLYDTFFKWENELTKIWQISQKIEQAEGRISRLKSYENLLNLQIETGIKQVIDEQGNLTDVSGEMINIFNAGVKELEDEIHLENQNIDEQRAHLEDLVNMDSKMEALEDIQDRLVNSALRPEDKKGNTKGSGGLIDSLVGGLSQEKLNDTSEFALLKAAEGLEKDIELQTRAWDFMSATQNADGTLNIDFDSEAFEATKYATGMTSEDAEAIQKYVKDVVETNNNLSSAYDSLTSKMVDMNDKLKTLQDQWVGYAEELWKISEEEQKQEIDNLKKLSDSLTNSLKKLLDEVKRKIDQRRKQEDNAKTELDISKKQQRLASLRADTSGGNQVEIAKLQQEIADAQQNYQRSLEDQLLENLQQQGDLAAQQREQQIALQEATITAVNNAALVNKWMDDPLKYREELFEAYKTANDFDKKPKALQQKLIQDFNKMFGGMITNQTQQETVENGLAATASELKVINSSINSIVNKSKENKSKKVTSTGAKSNTKVGDTQKKVDKAYAQAAAKNKKSESAQQSTSKKQTAPSKPQVSKISRDLREGMRGDDVKILQTALKQLGCTGRGYRPLTIDGYFGPDTASAVREFQRNYKYKASKTLAADGVVGKYSKEAFKALGFKTGGLADYTGPAWLDGTPSKPELVLNATDTQNFLALRDILSKAIGSTNAINNSYGGNATYEININVDKIEKDYDVDRVIDKVKKEITKGAGYRNVTQVRNFK